jgi:hypothetical protein
MWILWLVDRRRRAGICTRLPRPRAGRGLANLTGLHVPARKPTAPACLLAEAPSHRRGLPACINLTRESGGLRTGSGGRRSRWCSAGEIGSESRFRGAAYETGDRGIWKIEGDFYFPFFVRKPVCGSVRVRLWAFCMGRRWNRMGGLQVK